MMAAVKALIAGASPKNGIGLVRRL